MGADSSGPDQSTVLNQYVSGQSTTPDQPTVPEPPSPPPNHFPIQSSTPIPRALTEITLSEKARISLDHADQAEKSIGGSNTWQGVVERVKWVMDTLSPLAGVRVINILFPYPSLSKITLSAQSNCTDGVWSPFGDPGGAPICVLVGTKH